MSDWFSLFRANWLLGLLSLDLLFIAVYVLLVPMFLALYVALKRVNPAYMAIGTTLAFLGIAAYLASNTSIEMLSLSNRFEGASTDAQRSVFLAAGEAMLATYQGTAFHVSYILGSAAGIIIGAVMLRNNIFSRSIAYLMIFGNLVGFGLYLPKVGLALSALSGAMLWVWYLLLARRLLQLGKGLSDDPDLAVGASKGR